MVHESACPQWGLSKADALGACGCPVRAAATAVKSTWGRLQGVFRDAGLSSDWSPQDGTGNPCASAVVRGVIKLLQKEQLQAGLKALQAGLFDVSVFHAIMDHILGLWATYREEGRLVDAYVAARDALLYSVMWNTGMRASDTLRLLSQHIEEGRCKTASGEEVPCWHLHVAVSKSANAVGDARIVVIPDDGTPYAPMRVRLAMLDAATMLGLPRQEGLVFLDVVSRDSDDALVWGRVAQWKTLAATFKVHLQEMGLRANKTISLHSFHGSKGARDRGAGVLAEVTCVVMDWSLAMYNRYTEGRVPYSLSDLQQVVPSSSRRSRAAAGNAQFG